MSVIVYVWLPNEGRVGHTSMQIGPSTYVSFWPASAAGKKDVKIGESHEAAYPSSYSEDQKLEGGRADDEITLGGLDEARMIQSWNELKERNERYNLKEHNCSTVVASLLESGSGQKPSDRPRVNIDDYVSSLPARLLFRMIFFRHTLEMWSPAAVRDYAYEIRRRRLI
jgi:hypothetical protein